MSTKQPAAVPHAPQNVTIPLYGFGDASVTIPDEILSVFAEVNASHLSTITSILSDHMSGFKVDLTESDCKNLAEIAGALSHLSKRMVSELASRAGESTEGGAS